MSWLLYGANGYTGELIARAAVQRGQKPILAGRNEAVRELARELDCDSRVFPVEDAARHLDGVDAVLSCAGPFSRTAKAWVDACLERLVHYLDVTGEIAVFEALARRDAAAKERGVMLLPGVGYDVVPSDCLATHLAGRLPSATHLVLAMRALGSLSHGTATTMVEHLDDGGCVRENGKLVSIGHGHRTRRFDFGDGKKRHAITIPWGDVATAYYSTGIANIEVYAALPMTMRIGAKVLGALAPILARPKIKALLSRRIAPGGPSAEARARGASLLCGEVRDEKTGAIARARLTAPEGYAHTVDAATEVMTRVARGVVRPGFQTPSRVFGADFVLELPGVTRHDD